MRICGRPAREGLQVATVAPAATVAELLGLLAQHNVGALPVVDDGRLVGIVSERDVVRRLHDSGPGCSSAGRRHHDRGASSPARPDDKAADLARVMTDRRFRHLPVCDDGGWRDRQHR